MPRPPLRPLSLVRPRPLAYWLSAIVLFGVIGLMISPWGALLLHVWPPSRFVSAGYVVAAALGLHVFRVWPPTCGGLE